MRRYSLGAQPAPHQRSGIIPGLGILFCVLMVAPLLLDIFEKALRGDAISAMLLGGYSLLGAVIYWLYGSRHSTLATVAAQPEVA